MTSKLSTDELNNRVLLMSMEFEDILKHNIETKKDTEKCKHDLDEIKIIYQRCKTCGKFVVVPDEEYIKRRGVMGRG